MSDKLFLNLALAAAPFVNACEKSVGDMDKVDATQDTNANAEKAV
jgi:hypothetical protein